MACTAGTGSECATRDATKPACEPTTGACVACVTSNQCTIASAPICTGNTCVACKTDTECAGSKGADPGVCLSHLGGRCATAADVVYAKDDQGASCASASNAGTLGKPYCQVQDAVNAAVAQGKAAVVFRGPRGQRQVKHASAGKTLLLVGQQGAFLAPSVDGPGITLTAGTLYARNLIIEGSKDVGIKASGAQSTLHLSQATITGNAGGILVDGAGFVIENTIVAANKVGQFGITSFGGMLINNPGNPKTLRHVTVFENDVANISCSSSVEAVGLATSPKAADTMVKIS